jgi:hypothetical protein
MSYTQERATFLDDGLFLTSSPAAGSVPTAENRPLYWFHLYDFWAESGSTQTVLLRRSFGRIPDEEQQRGPPWDFAERKIAYSGGTTFWAAPPIGVGRGYELELWDALSGSRRRVIRREVPWFAKGADRAQGWLGDGATPTPVAEVAGLHEDGTGLIVVVVYVPNPAWKPPPRGPRSAQERRGDYDAMYDVYTEVIDANASVVLASHGPMRPSQSRMVFPVGYIKGTRLGVQFGETADGLINVRISPVRLEAVR